MKLISGNSNRPLAAAVAQYMKMVLANTTIRRFADQEIFVEIEDSVRGEDIFIVQSTSFPANDHVMELLILIDALKRGSAGRITAVIPYYGYARQDRKTAPRTPISAKLIANLLTVAGADRVLTLEFHSEQIHGFFDIPVDNLLISPVFVREITSTYDLSNVMIVSPDIGGLRRARAIANQLNTEIGIIDKRRDQPGISEVVNVIGHVNDKDCIMVDDIVDSGGTLCNAARALKDAGARSVNALVVHGVLSGDSITKIGKSQIDQLMITDTILVRPDILQSPKIKQISIAPLLAEAITCISQRTSVSELFV